MLTRLCNLMLVLVLALGASLAAFGQVQRDSKAGASGDTLSFQNPLGASAQTFEYVVAGSPTGASIVLKGCMAGATCDTLETNTATASTIRTVAVNYDYFTVALTLTGGTSPTVRVNTNFTLGTTPNNALLTTVPVDPCASPNAAKSSASIAFNSATTAALVAAAAGKKVYVCAFTLTMSSGTTPTMQFKTGTGGTCGTGTATLTGVMALPTASGSLITVGAGHTMFAGAAAAELCLTTAGTTPTGNGFLTYVQQ